MLWCEIRRLKKIKKLAQYKLNGTQASYRIYTGCNVSHVHVLP